MAIARPWVALAVAAAVLAGCTHKATPAPATDPALAHIRGLVVDAALRPLAGVAIQATGQSAANATTDPGGLFTLGPLPPGAYGLSVAKAGFITAQLSADAVVGTGALVKVVLEANAGSQPYAEAFVFDGYIECGTSSIALCAAPNFVTLAACSTAGACVVGNVTDDRFNANYMPSGVPDWTQSELVWSATVSASDQFYFSVSHFPRDDLTALETVYNSTVGGSPLLLTVPGNATHETGLGAIEQWRESVFSGAAKGTTPPGCSPPCTGPGVALQQHFSIYTHFFFHYQPPPGWRFTESEVPRPPAQVA